MYQSKLEIVVAVLLSIGALSLGVGGFADERPHGAVLVRVPNHGIQPQAAVDDKGFVHLLYFKGEPGSGDIFWVRSEDGIHFNDPIRVNSQPGSAVATGNIR